MEINSLNENILDKVYPIGSVYVTSSFSIKPQELFGGEWSLIDKMFTPMGIAYSNVNPGEIYGFGSVTSTNIITATVQIARDSHTLLITGSFKNKVAFTDTTVQIGKFSFYNLGIFSQKSMFPIYSVGTADGGNTLLMLEIKQDGTWNCNDIIDIDSWAAGNTCTFSFSIPCNYSDMLDNVCNKFYWKRTK